jgi:hypothetical protein
MADDADTDQGDDYGTDDSDESAYDGGDDGDDSGDGGDAVSEFAGGGDGGDGGAGDYADGYGGGYGGGDDDGSDGDYAGGDTGDETSDASGSDDGGYSSDPEDGQPNQSTMPELMCEWQGQQYPVGTVMYLERGSAYDGFPARGYYRCNSYETWADWAPDHDVESKANKRDPWPSDEAAGQSQVPDVDGPHSAERGRRY